jgi:hypothetical protein
MKGLHKVLSIFEEFPDFQLHLFGLNEADKKILTAFSGNNIINHGFVDLRDSNFQRIIAEQAAVISASYSEGMQTSIATALCLGTKAIVTKQCGYTSSDTGVLVTSHENLKSTIYNFSLKGDFQIDPADVLDLRKRYSARTFQQNISTYLG